MFKKSTLSLFGLSVSALMGCGSGGGSANDEKPAQPVSSATSSIVGGSNSSSSSSQAFDEEQILGQLYIALNPPLQQIGLLGSGLSIQEFTLPILMTDRFNRNEIRPADLLEKFENRKQYPIDVDVGECDHGDITKTGMLLLTHVGDFKKSDYGDCLYTDDVIRTTNNFLSGSILKELTVLDNIDVDFDWNVNPDAPGRATKVDVYEDFINVSEDEYEKDVFTRSAIFIDGSIVSSVIAENSRLTSTVKVAGYTLKFFHDKEVGAGTPFDFVHEEAVTLKSNSYAITVVQTAEDGTSYSYDGDFTIADGGDNNDISAMDVSVKTINPMTYSSAGLIAGELDTSVKYGSEKSATMIKLQAVSLDTVRISVDADGNGTTDYSFERDTSEIDF
jgi:hypothetical protein